MFEQVMRYNLVGLGQFITCSKIEHIPYKYFLQQNVMIIDFNYDYFMGLYEFVVGE